MNSIDCADLDTTFRDCLFREDEPRDSAVLVEGITVGKFGLHPDRLESYRPAVEQWLACLPKTFRRSGDGSGGGWSFLQACMTDDGTQWGEHHNMEQLFVLAIGLGLAEWQLPRNTWAMLPGGMPYVSIDVPSKEATT